MLENVNITPFRFRELSGKMLVTNEVGDYGTFDSDVVDRFFSDQLTDTELNKFRELSILVEPEAEWKLASLMRRIQSSAKNDRQRLSYLIIIPTLRCNLSCGYCQVSRAPIDAVGFDWTDEQIGYFEAFLDTIESDRLKLEFQGGEPTLRPDLLNQIIKICTAKFTSVEFVICSNLTDITNEIEEIIARDDVVVSTSIDGPLAVMTANRTSMDDVSQKVFDNIQYVIRKYGPSKVSALPTVTDQIIDKPEELIDCYVDFGFESIFLRPVNYMGFARKRFSELSNEFEKWQRFYLRALEYIVDLNREHYFEEFYLSMMLRSIFAELPHGFVDFRSPSRFLEDYCVIDFDGKIYPTDEARMLSRTRHIDLAVGHMRDGVDPTKVQDLNFHAINQVNQDCQHCVYMPHCGIDIIDDISRYGRVDVPKHETWFCNRQMMLFDLIFEKVIQKDRRWLDAFLKWIFRGARITPSYEVFGD